MSALSALETPVAATNSRGAARSGVSGRDRPLRVVRGSARTSAIPADVGSRFGAEPCSSSIRQSANHQIPILTGTIVAGRGRFASAANCPASPVPIRLTRRGRVVTAVLLVTVLSAAVLLITMLVSGGAQATNHGAPRAGYQGMHQVVVRPGQTLWSIASAAAPTADPRNVVQEIMSANALANPGISVGQLLWVP